MVYITRIKQNRGVLRWLYLNNFNYNVKPLQTQLLHNLLDSVLNYKKSTLYLKKLSVYNKLIYNK